MMHLHIPRFNSVLVSPCVSSAASSKQFYSNIAPFLRSASKLQVLYRWGHGHVSFFSVFLRQQRVNINYISASDILYLKCARSMICGALRVARYLKCLSNASLRSKSGSSMAVFKAPAYYLADLNVTRMLYHAYKTIVFTVHLFHLLNYFCD